MSDYDEVLRNAIIESIKTTSTSQLKEILRICCEAYLADEAAKRRIVAEAIPELAEGLQPTPLHEGAILSKGITPFLLKEPDRCQTNAHSTEQCRRC